ncbi:hypothetical protein MMC08_001466 [Hypocenomyce scalaris]|nr:hypothetical protein [Hypocenomyce scalaris]
MLNMSDVHSFADLEADVDDPATVGDWREADEDETSDPNDAQLSVANGQDSIEAELKDEPNDDTSDNVDDEVLSTMTTRNLSIANLVNPEPTPPNLLEQIAVPAATANLLTRRIEARTTPPQHREVSNARALDIAVGNSLSSNQSNMSTSQSPPDEGPTAEASSTLRATTPTHLEILGPDGPTTPRNDAGPFVFDGSAGRVTGRRAVAPVAEAADSPTSSNSCAGTETSDGVPVPT